MRSGHLAILDHLHRLAEVLPATAQALIGKHASNR